MRRTFSAHTGIRHTGLQHTQVFSTHRSSTHAGFQHTHIGRACWGLLTPLTYAPSPPVSGAPLSLGTIPWVFIGSQSSPGQGEDYAAFTFRWAPTFWVGTYAFNIPTGACTYMFTRARRREADREQADAAARAAQRAQFTSWTQRMKQAAAEAARVRHAPAPAPASTRYLRLPPHPRLRRYLPEISAPAPASLREPPRESLRLWCKRARACSRAWGEDR